jgi:mediator of RNA polymerase II transcription subunit 17
MGSIQDDFAISLQSWPLKTPDPIGSLPDLIGRIDEQRGGFRNITEEGLRQEIVEEDAAAVAGEDAVSEDGEEKEEEEPDRVKALQDARMVMLHNI